MRQQQIPIGLATDGRWWSVVWAPLGGVTSITTWDAALKEVLADKAVQEKMINAGVVASYQDSRGMTARVEQDRKLTQTLFGH